MAVVKFFRGLMIAMPISLALWALIALALYLYVPFLAIRR
jgi:hypothetical protein